MKTLEDKAQEYSVMSGALDAGYSTETEEAYRHKPFLSEGMTMLWHILIFVMEIYAFQIKYESRGNNQAIKGR